MMKNSIKKYSEMFGATFSIGTVIAYELAKRGAQVIALRRLMQFGNFTLAKIKKVLTI